MEVIVLYRVLRFSASISSGLLAWTRHRSLTRAGLPVTCFDLPVRPMHSCTHTRRPPARRAASA